MVYGADKVTSPNDRIEYRYLNVDQERFYANERKLIESVGKGGVIRALMSYQYNQALIAAGHLPFTDIQARMVSQKLTGVLPLNDGEEL